MGGFQWDEEKNKWLKAHRSISFEEIAIRIESGYLVTVLENDKPQYAGQFIAVLRIDDYAWAVPYRDSEDGKWLITAFPSRALTKLHLRRGHDDEP